MTVPAPGLASDLEVIEFASQTLQAGQGAALATIVGVDGPFSRPLGAQLAIAEGGTFAGSISGGCLENALCEEAVQALQAGVNKTLRYGEGSPFVDVRLPCGGGLDIFLDTHLNPATLTEAIRLGHARKPFSLAIDTSASGEAMNLTGPSSDEPSSRFTREFLPTVRLVLAGRGWEIVALSQAAHQVGYEVAVLSQEAATLEYCRPFARTLTSLQTPARAPDLELDAQSAFVCLFHEHEWEIALLTDALRSPAFYIGALGSRQTSQARLPVLRDRGLTDTELDRLHGPLGLFHAQAPHTLAISALSEIMSKLPVRAAAR